MIQDDVLSSDGGNRFNDLPDIGILPVDRRRRLLGPRQCRQGKQA
jgi:hypothetical protein